MIDHLQEIGDVDGPVVNQVSGTISARAPMIDHRQQISYMSSVLPYNRRMPESRYVTTPIFYVNDKPHIGHIYTSTVCDVYARFLRFAGKDVFFLTGTDEHGQKVEKSATARGISPQELADENAAIFQRVMRDFNISNDDFIRTTQPRHEKQVQSFITKLLASDAVYLGEFEGWYDEGQEEYYTETKAKELEYKSPISKKPLTRAREKNYYFRLSAFQRRLEEFFANNPEFVRPEGRRNEVLGRIREGLQDVPISRTNFKWGIGMPNDPAHVVYVWVDALFNYITALGLGESPDHELHRERAKYWPATYHVIGKEILWFHAVIWPAMLMALDLPTPHCVYAHSFWISEGQKMSKSMGNFIDLAAIDHYTKTYGMDAWRYYLITQGPLGSADADFAAARFHSVYEKDLVSTVGNCASRVTAMIARYCDGLVPEMPHTGAMSGGQPFPYIDWASAAKHAFNDALASAEDLNLPGVVNAAMELIRSVDGYINACEPFKLAKDPSKKTDLNAILYQCMEAVRIASLLLWPIMPAKMEELWSAMGLQIDPRRGNLHGFCEWGGLKGGTKITKVALFPRVEPAPTPQTASA